MELSWSTFVLEIINFLVLVWILKHFLYKPILDVIAARRQAVEAQLAEANTKQEEARSLQEQYTGRLKEWEAERRDARAKLAHEIDEERSRRLSALREDLDREREKAHVAEERQQEEKERALEQQALRQGALFSSRLLGEASGPELEDRLTDILIDDLTALSAEQRSRLREQWQADSVTIDVASAFELPDAQRERLATALLALCGQADIRYRRDETLLAGLHIEIGDWVLAANVRDELRGFAELASAAR